MRWKLALVAVVLAVWAWLTAPAWIPSVQIDRLDGGWEEAPALFV